MEESNKAELGQVTQRRLTSVGYWRFSVNAALTLLDMVMFCVASAVVINVRHEIDIYSFRFGFPINLYIYLSVCALIWAFCMHTAGIYHRHVMGDGYQLNVLLTKGAMFAAVMTCAFNFIMRITMSLAAIVLSFVFGLLLTMVERFIMRAVITNCRRKGRYSYATVVVGSPDGIEHALEFLAQKQQLNYRPVAICPIRLNPVTGLVEADDDISGLSKRVKNVLGMGVPIMTYSDDFAEHAVSLHAQTVMVTDVMYRFSDNFNTFALGVESMNLEIAVVTSAVDASGHETR
ncbi:nucleoside-diphosphate sugar epimerase/dehydratase, partial [Bifidobacterium merycicum]